jgi:hypothetical protein
MKKLILVAAVAIAAVVAAPITSASADKFKGNCFVEGKATFGVGLGFSTPVENMLQKTTYEFKSAPVEAKNKKAQVVFCTGEDLTTTEAGPWTGEGAEVTGGKGELECGTKSRDEGGGTATIKLKQGANPVRTFSSKFAFKSTPVPGEIAVELTEGGAKGPANFVGPGNENEKALTLENCRTLKAKNLNFETANIAGTEIGIQGTIG